LSLIEVYTQLAHAHCIAGNLGEAALQINKALALAAKTQTQDPKDVGVYDEMTKLYNVAGNFEIRSGDDRKALAYYQKAIGILTKLQSEHPSTAFTRQRLAATFNNIGRTQVQLQNLKLASDAFREALMLVGSETTSTQPNVQSLYTEADSYAGLGDLESQKAVMQTGERATAHWQQACASYEASLRISRLIKEPGMISPNGFDLVPPSTVASGLSKCRLVLASGRRQ
jgi:tetratricopeptide (TPR) repeat protein